MVPINVCTHTSARGERAAESSVPMLMISYKTKVCFHSIPLFFSRFLFYYLLFSSECIVFHVSNMYVKIPHDFCVDDDGTLLSSNSSNVSLAISCMRTSSACDTILQTFNSRSSGFSMYIAESVCFRICLPLCSESPYFSKSQSARNLRKPISNSSRLAELSVVNSICDESRKNVQLMLEVMRTSSILVIRSSSLNVGNMGCDSCCRKNSTKHVNGKLVIRGVVVLDVMLKCLAQWRTVNISGRTRSSISLKMYNNSDM